MTSTLVKRYRSYIECWVTTLTKELMDTRVVINDPLGQSHSSASSDNNIYFKIVLFCSILKSGKWERTTCVKTVIIGRPNGSIFFKTYGVFAVGGVTVTGLIGAEVHAGVVIVDGVTVVVVGGGVGGGGVRGGAVRGGVVGGGAVDVAAEGDGQDGGKDDEGLKDGI